MKSELKALKQHILRVEAGGAPTIALRREYNAKVQAYRRFRGGGGDKQCPLNNWEDVEMGEPNGSKILWQGYLRWSKSKGPFQNLGKERLYTFYNNGQLNRHTRERLWKGIMTVWSDPVAYEQTIIFYDMSGNKVTLNAISKDHNLHILEKLMDEYCISNQMKKMHDKLDSLELIQSKVRVSQERLKEEIQSSMEKSQEKMQKQMQILQNQVDLLSQVASVNTVYTRVKSNVLLPEEIQQIYRTLGPSLLRLHHCHCKFGTNGHLIADMAGHVGVMLKQGAIHIYVMGDPTKNIAEFDINDTPDKKIDKLIHLYEMNKKHINEYQRLPTEITDQAPHIMLGSGIDPANLFAEQTGKLSLGLIKTRDKNYLEISVTPDATG